MAKDATKTPKESARSKSPNPKSKKKKAAEKVEVIEKDPLTPEERAASDFGAKMALYAGVVLPWVAGVVVFSMEGFKESFYLDKAYEQPKHLDRLVMLIAALSIPHVFYAWAWTHSKQWARMCHAHSLEPFKAFANTAHVIKAIQFTALGMWVYSTLGKDPVQEIQDHFVNMHPLKVILCLQLAALGQVLNMAVYQKIGEAGVYYGTRLGIHVPWAYGFPFSVVSHAQYFGATLSFTGMFIAIATPVTVQEGIYVVTAVMACFYTFSSYVEGNL